MTVSQFLEDGAGGCWERGGDLFRLGGCSFYLKNKVTSEMFFHVITKNLNWKVLTKNSAIFKRWVGLKVKNF